MNWLGPLPVQVPGLPGLTGAVLLWTIPFMASALYVGPLAGRAWHGYLAARKDPLAGAERAYALGQAIARTCGLLMVVSGLAAGLVASITPPPQLRRPPTPLSAALITTLVMVSVLIAIQSFALQTSQRAAEEILERASQEAK